ncbi:ATP-dependent protease La (LON) domain protein [Artemisia annua]|uniref:Protein cereblon n=1 Tax=Artemisia annua TaxID=35608 RepID=A0A2U1QKH9_ARTAN|nr:ATP-dependent protease La (LON) domain protein [Artemisia annua]
MDEEDTENNNNNNNNNERRLMLLERELLQIEQIRQLDSEELEIEEVEHGHQSSDDDDARQFDDRTYGGASAPGGYTFNTSLASMHSYLGEVEDTHNRMAFLDGGVILNVPLFYLEGVVLFPEATLPLRVIQPNFIAAVDRALRQVEAPYTIGVVRVYRDTDDGRIRFATTGTTAEIRQYRRLEDGSINVVTRGQQRFRLKRRWIEVEGAPCGEIQIIEEDLPLRTPRDAVGQLTPLTNLSASSTSHSKLLDHDSDALSDDSFESELSLTERRLHTSALVSSYRSDLFGESTSSDDEKFMCEPEHSSLHSTNNRSDEVLPMKKVMSHRPCRGAKRVNYSLRSLRECPRAYWPNWVYQMYDSYTLAQRLSDMWKKVVGTPNMETFVRKPGLLSFHVASKIPVSESTRQELLEIDGISYRLRREIQLLENFDQIKCRSCQTLIANRSDMLVMSTDGPLGAYVNPSGYVHEIMTLLKANGLALIGVPTEEYSWFPGYAWTVAYCATCEYQMGWLFTAINKKLKPRSFWGIRSSQVADDTR